MSCSRASFFMRVRVLLLPGARLASRITGSRPNGALAKDIQNAGLAVIEHLVGVLKEVQTSVPGSTSGDA
jgi:hypothetical protein